MEMGVFIAGKKFPVTASWTATKVWMMDYENLVTQKKFSSVEKLMVFHKILK